MLTRKEYIQAERALRKFARSKDVPVRITPASPKKLPYLAYFDYKRRRIRIWKGLRKLKPYFIYVLAHEIGHSIDYDSMQWSRRKDHDKWARLFHRAHSFGCRFPAWLQNFILGCERRANRNGEKLMKKLDIKLPARLIRSFQKIGIDSYKSMFSARSP